MRFLLPLLLLCLLRTGGRAQNVLTWPREPAHEVSPLLYGQFIEHLGRCVDGGLYEEGSALSDGRGFRTDVLELVKDLETPLLRFPGGTVTKIYHWKNGIGPKSERRKRPNLIWGGNIQYHFGTAEFIEYCRAIGAEPMLIVNMATGTPEEAAEWVEYCNGTGDTYWANLRREHGYAEPFNVKFWGIGNEESADADAGRHYTSERYVFDTWQFVKLMKLTDPTLNLTLVGDTRSRDWNEHIIRELHPVMDNLAVHFYAVPNDSTYASLLSSVYQYEPFLESLWAQARAAPPTGELSRWYRFPGRQQPLKLAVDEWGIWNMDSPKGKGAYNLEYPFNWGHALGTAAFLNIFTRHADKISLATWAQTVNVLAPIMTDEAGAWKQTVYLPLREYRRRMTGRYLDLGAVVPTGPATGLDLVAVQHDARTINVAAINLDERAAARLPLNIPPGYRLAEATTFTAPTVYAVAGRGDWPVRATAWTWDQTLPAASLTFITLVRK